MVLATDRSPVTKGAEKAEEFMMGCQYSSGTSDIDWEE